MNPDAKKYFEDNPGEYYWYYSPTIRVPNPRIKPWNFKYPVPWPKETT